jgi:hypothetical protein
MEASHTHNCRSVSSTRSSISAKEPCVSTLQAHVVCLRELTGNLNPKLNPPLLLALLLMPVSISGGFSLGLLML